MKICMVGLGSMGTRHLKNLHRLFNGKSEPLQIDALRSALHGGTRPVLPEVSALINREYDSFEKLPDDYDVAFIANPTDLHFGSVRAVISKARHLFIEKPVFDRSDLDWEALPWRTDGIYYVACPLRYHRVVQYIKNQLTGGLRAHAVRSICSSYLPDWRPGTDYRQSYSASKERGGGVRIDLIHEWDYLYYLFGAPLEVAELHGTFSTLDISSEDVAVYVAGYRDKVVSLHLDYFGRFSRREIELYGSEDILVGDLIGQRVRYLRAGEVIDLPQERDEMQLSELVSFFEMIAGKQSNHNPVRTAVNTLKIALGEFSI